MSTTEAPGRLPGGRRFDRTRLRLGIVVALVAGGLVFLAMQLGQSTTYFRNADEAVAERDDLGTRRFRLQGTVVPGSVEPAGDTVAFQVEYRCARVPVVHRGDPPELFKPGIPVVLEGAFADASETYRSDRMFVRHTSEYRTEESERIALAEQEARDR